VVAYAEAYRTFLCSLAPFSLCWTGMHCPSRINPQCLAKQLIQTNQRSLRRVAWHTHVRHCMFRLESARFNLHKASQGLPVYTEEPDKEAVTEKKTGGKIISASFRQCFYHWHSRCLENNVIVFSAPLVQQRMNIILCLIVRHIVPSGTSLQTFFGAQPPHCLPFLLYMILKL